METFSTKWLKGALDNPRESARSIITFKALITTAITTGLTTEDELIKTYLLSSSDYDRNLITIQNWKGGRNLPDQSQRLKILMWLKEKSDRQE